MTLIHYMISIMWYISKVDELRVDFYDNYCNLIHKKCQQKDYHSDKKPYDTKHNIVYLQMNRLSLGTNHFRVTSHTRTRASDQYISSTLISGKGGPVKFALHYAWGTNGVCECKMDVKSTWTPTWHATDHVSWSLGLFSRTTSWR